MGLKYFLYDKNSSFNTNFNPIANNISNSSLFFAERQGASFVAGNRRSWPAKETQREMQFFYYPTKKVFSSKLPDSHRLRE